jgi:hypothetical protein
MLTLCECAVAASTLACACVDDSAVLHRLWLPVGCCSDRHVRAAGHHRSGTTRGQPRTGRLRACIKRPWQAVNYVEHYGLSRTQQSDGSYEPVNVKHSWNSDSRITHAFLFKLQRHSDHHANSTRRYQVLRSFEESPQMPTGYAGMILLSLIPPLWFWVMDGRVEAHRKANKLAS